MIRKNKLTSLSYKWHQRLAYLGGVIFIVFIISALTHPLLSWTGPKAKKFFPPSFNLESEDFENFAEIINRKNIEEAQQLKLIAAKNGALIQLTEKVDSPRRYFSLHNGSELADYDEQQAKFLAEYYTARPSEEILSTQFISEFSNEYPWVNRLLPVYKVTYQGDENLTVYVHTELNALAGITNNYKQSLQTVFQNFHTFSFLNSFESVRVILLMLMMLILIALGIMGYVLLRNFKKRKNLSTAKKWHRRIAYLVWVPLLMFSFSGLYHLFHSSGLKQSRALDYGSPMNLKGKQLISPTGLDSLSGCNSFSLVQRESGDFCYRISLSAGQGAIERKDKYKGQKTERKALYLAATGDIGLNLNDQSYASEKLMEFRSESSVSQKLITHFGPHYDFRNKRLPVWQFDYADGEKVFFDPAAACVVDRLNNSRRYERYSFSFLHKWNFLSPLIGRQNRDYVIVFFLFLGLALSLSGYYLLVVKHKKK